MPKHQHTAVDRNRLKRRVRELVRVELLPSLRTGSAVDMVIRAEREAYRASFDQLRKGLIVLLGRFGGAGSDPV